MKTIAFFLLMALIAFYAIPEPFNLAGLLVVAGAGIASK